MKIGLLTWYNNLNYGTVLQLTALSGYLTSRFGAEVEVISYTPQEAHTIDKIKTIGDHFFTRLSEAVNKKLHPAADGFGSALKTDFAKETVIKTERFRTFLNALTFTEAVTDFAALEALGKRYDLLICGSDQIWNPRILNPVFYLDFVRGTKKLSYAASLGVSYVPRYAKKYIRRYLADFSAVSLREDTCAAAVGQLSPVPVHVVCDPTFLLGADRWSEYADKSGIRDNGYLLNYFLGNSARHETVFDAVSKTLGKPLHTLPSSVTALRRSRREDLAAGPAEFLALVKNADFVVTDSFHATCFSIIFQVPFCVVQKHREDDPFNQNSRVNFLLQKLGLENRIAATAEDAARIAATPIDFAQVTPRLDEFIRQSKDYLDRNVGNDV